MDKMLEISSVSQNHGISINERKSIYITGVLKIDNFDEEEFLLEGPHKRRNMWFNSMIREEPYPGLNCRGRIWRQ